ncbi:hypothetical protein BZG83_12400, partial [Salinivibrio sp. PR919]
AARRPVNRRSTSSKSTEASILPFPLDLHVLGLPPAFNLSHDQTLQLKFFRNRSFSSMNTDYCFSPKRKTN